jgi:hypothetical protein
MRVMLYAWAASAALLLSTANATTMSLDPAAQTVGEGSLLQVNLTIAGVNNGTTPALGAWDVTVSADPSLLTFSSATFGTNLNVLGLGDIQSVSSPATGSTELYEISLDSAADLTSHQATNFTLATLYFNTIGTGTSALNIGINSLSDANGSALTASVVPGSVTINPVPLPSSVWLLASALAALGFVLRPRRPIGLSAFA